MDLNLTNLAGNLTPSINWSDMWNSLPTSLIGELNFIINLSKIALIIIIIYFVILIISKLMSIRNSNNISKIASQVVEINNKLSLLTGKSKLGKKDKSAK